MILQDDDSFKVLQFNPENLALALSNDITTVEQVKNKFHYHYFLDYFGSKEDGLEIKTILVENKHISQSYLKDYSFYFASTFLQYSSFCKRIHFFTTDFTSDAIADLMDDRSKWAKKIWTSYSGYTTVKPLPDAKLGSTVIKTKHEKHIYSAVRDYTVYLLGKEIVLKSLAFQEQDGIVSRCATIAIWTALHKNSQLFYTSLPAPVEITLAAHSAFSGGRLMPNEGLNQIQICKVFDAFGLVTELRTDLELKNRLMIKRFIYAYLRNGFPVLVGIRIKDEQNREQNHIITFVGFKDDVKVQMVNVNDSDTQFHADYINHYFAHDDQSGPFSKVTFVDQNGNVQITRKAFDASFILRPDDCRVVSIFVAVSNMIKIAFDDVMVEVTNLDFAFKSLQFNPTCLWDVYLSSAQEYQGYVRKKKGYPQTVKSRVLSQCLPKYIWVARMMVEDDVVMEFVFDATALKISTNFCLLAYPIYEELKPFFDWVFTQYDDKELLSFFNNPHYIKLLKESMDF